MPVLLDWPRQSREGKHGDPAPNLLATVPVRGSLPPWPTLPDRLPGQFWLPGSTSIFKQVCSWQPSMCEYPCPFSGCVSVWGFTSARKVHACNEAISHRAQTPAWTAMSMN